MLVLQHIDHEGPGLIAEEARRRGLTLDVRPIPCSLPGVEEFGGLVVMGGPMSANDVAGHPRLEREAELLATAAATGLPVLGVCLGAQLLARAVGGRVMPGPSSEVGAGDVELTPEGAVDPLLGGGDARLPVYHWHGDTFELPPEAVLLARTPSYRQAFRVGVAYGFQFHVEVTAELATAWRPHLPAGASLTSAAQRRIEEHGRPIVRRWIDLVAGVRGGVSDARRSRPRLS